MRSLQSQSNEIDLVYFLMQNFQIRCDGHQLDIRQVVPDLDRI